MFILGCPCSTIQEATRLGGFFVFSEVRLRSITQCAAVENCRFYTTEYNKKNYRSTDREIVQCVGFYMLGHPRLRVAFFHANNQKEVKGMPNHMRKERRCRRGKYGDSGKERTA